MDSKILIKLDNICAGYNTKEVLHDISLTIPEKGFTGIMGPNGGGKTTLLKVMLGLVKPTAGAVRFFSNGNLSDEIVRTGYLPQQNTSDKRFPISVREVILSGLLGGRRFLRHYSREDAEKSSKIIDEMGLNDVSDNLFGQLSGGQRQRTLLGRALISQPEVLFLDEPSTYFDQQAREWMNRKLHLLQQTCSVVMVSHDLQDLQSYGGQVFCIENGRIKACRSLAD